MINIHLCNHYSFQEGDVVHMKTCKGFKKKAIVKEILQQPRSYLDESNGTLYRRNRNLLKINEEIKRTEERAKNACEEKQTKNASEDVEVCTRLNAWLRNRLDLPISYNWFCIGSNLIILVMETVLYIVVSNFIKL